MLLTPHLLTGAAIASKISNPAWALPLALLSHYFLDLPPQQEYSINNIKEGRWRKSFFDFLKVSLDIAFGILLIFLFSKNTPLIFAAAFLAIAPDGLYFLKILFPQNKLLIQHHKFHKAANDICNPEEKKKIPSFWGILSQVVIIILAILFLI